MATSSTEITHLAAAHGLELNQESITVNEMGLDFRVAIARTVDDEAWVLRIPRRPEVMERAGVEGRLLALVAPKLTAAVPDWHVHTSDLIAYPLLPGEPGLDLDSAGEPVCRADASASTYATTLGEFLAQLHGIDPVEAETTGIESRNPSQVRQAWRSDIDTVCSNFDVADHLTDRWSAWLDEDDHWPDRSVLTHGEIYPGHTLVVDNAITAVLDWTTSSVGDPAKDFVFHRATASDQAFDLTVQTYVDNGGQVWPGLAAHCTEMYSASPVHYGMYAMLTGENEHREAAAEQLNPPAGS